MAKFFNIVFSVFCWIQMSYASTDACIIGFVHSAGGEPLEGVNVSIAGSALGGTTGTDGRFEIRGLGKGEYQLESRHIGFVTKNVTVSVQSGIATRLRITLTPTVIRLPEVEINAEKSRHSLRSVAPNVIVIERAAIEKSAVQNVTELLATVPGVFVKTYGNAGAPQSISIRGSEGNQVVVLIDGEPVTDSQSGRASLNAIPVAAVERVEVLKGSASGMFGSGAIGGVVNIITASFDAHEFDFSHYLGGGSFGSGQAGGEFRSNHGNLAFSGAVSWEGSRGDFGFTNTARVSRPRQHRDNADYDAYNTFLKSRLLLQNSTFLEISGQFYALETGVPGEIGNPTPNARFDERRYLANATLISSPDPTSTVTLTGKYHVFQNGFVSPGANPRESANHNDRIGLDARYQLQFNDALQLTFGSGFLSDAVSGSSIDGSRMRRNWAMFATGRMDLGRGISLFPSLRLDLYSGGEKQLSPKAGILYKDVLKNGLDLHASAGRAFRIPDFNSLFFISGVQVENNPSLQPERAVDYDAGVNYRIPMSAMTPEISASLYHRKTRGTILWLPDFRFVWSPRNIGAVVSRGAEFSLSVSDRNKKRFRASLNYTLANTRFDLRGNSNPVPYRPDHLLSGTLLLHLGIFDLSAEQRYVSHRYPNVAGTNIMDDYWLSDIAFFSAVEFLGAVFKPKASIHNIFSREYQVVANFPMPGREVRLKLEVEY
jgi:outer membrane cobalamin receptor